jgi:hypothetical protein
VIKIYRGETEIVGRSYNKISKTVFILLGIGLTTYLCVDIYTQGLISINLHYLWDYLFKNNNIHSDLDSDLSYSSIDSNRTVTPSNYNSRYPSPILDASPQQGVNSAGDSSPTLGSLHTPAEHPAFFYFIFNIKDQVKIRKQEWKKKLYLFLHLDQYQKILDI